MKYGIKSVALLFLLLNLKSYFLSPYPLFAADLSSQKPITISASVGTNRITLFGYTSPLTRVEMSSPNIFAVSYSDSNGFFVFDKTIISKNYHDICLTSVNDSRVRTTPICIPPPPPTNYHTDIGPIVLPPTVFLDHATISPHSTNIISGFTIPYSSVSIVYFQENNTAPLLPPVNAYSLPTVTVVSGKDGNFSLSLPTSYASNYRLYAYTSFNQHSSPKSNTLLYKLPSFWYIYFIQHIFIFAIAILSIFIVSGSYLIYISKHGSKTRHNTSK